MRAFLIWLFITGLAIFFPIQYASHLREENPDISISIDNKVQDAIEVEEFDYKFQSFKSGFLSGAGAGGQGAAIMWMPTPESFVENLNPGEKIFTEVIKEEKVEKDGYIYTDADVEKLYIAGVENRAHLVGFKDTFKPPADYKYKAHDDSKIVYKYVLSSNSLFFKLSGIYVTVMFFVLFFGWVRVFDSNY